MITLQKFGSSFYFFSFILTWAGIWMTIHTYAPIPQLGTHTPIVSPSIRENPNHWSWTSSLLIIGFNEIVYFSGQLHSFTNVALIIVPNKHNISASYECIVGHNLDE